MGGICLIKSIIIWRLKREIFLLCCILVYQLSVSVGASVLGWTFIRSFMQSVHILTLLWTCDCIDIFLASSGYLNMVPVNLNIQKMKVCVTSLSSELSHTQTLI